MARSRTSTMSEQIVAEVNFLWQLSQAGYTGSNNYPFKNLTLSGLAINRATPITSITDGTSNTILVVESAARPVICTVSTGCNPLLNGNVWGSGAWADPLNNINPVGAFP